MEECAKETEEEEKEEEKANGHEEEETLEETYQKFEQPHKYFTDYMQSIMSEKSKIELPYFSGTFSLYSEGAQILDNSYKLEEYTDAFRNMLEVCDTVKGVRVVLDSNSGFGSFAEKYL